MKIRNTSEDGDKIELQMTPMIDIVFQLLVFFVMTFKIVSMEGDFNIKMPRSAPRAGNPPPGAPPLRLDLNSNSDGQLVSMQIGQKSFSFGEGYEKGFNELRNYMIEQFGGTSGPAGPDSGAEVELAFNYNLKYEWVVAAMDAISGYPESDGRIVHLVEKIKFAPARGAPSQ